MTSYYLSNNKMKIFVINAYPYRSKKYKKDNRYILYKPRPYQSITSSELKKHTFRHNANRVLRQKIASSVLAHEALLQRIINQDLKNVIIMEDDITFNANIDEWKSSFREFLKREYDYNICFLVGK